MKHTPPSIFPNGFSDESAAALTEFLNHLAAACEKRYAVQLRRHYSGQRNLYDPEPAWRMPPGDPF